MRNGHELVLDGSRSFAIPSTQELDSATRKRLENPHQIACETWLSQILARQVDLERLKYKVSVQSSNARIAVVRTSST
jgi:hypothetical protein